MRFSLWLESVNISQAFGKDPRFQRFKEFVKQVPEVADFLKKVDQKYRIINMKPGMTATLVRTVSPPNTGFNFGWTQAPTEYRIPVRVADTDEINVYLQRTDGGDWSFLHHLMPVLQDKGKTWVFQRSRVNLVNNEPYERFLNWFTYLLMKSGITKGKQARQFFAKLFSEHGSSLDATVMNNQRLAKMANQGYGLEQFQSEFPKESEDPEYAYDLAKSKGHRSNKVGPQGRDIIDFPNGWKWVSLDTHYSPEEGEAAGHCGNVAGQPGENVLSLRDNKGFVHLTFTTDSEGYLIERKAPGNRKPQPYTYKYILKLLEDPIVKGLKQSQYLPEMDFQLADLSPEEFVQLAKKRPDLAKTNLIEKAAIFYKNPRKFTDFLSRKFGVKIERTLHYDAGARGILIDQVDDEMLAKKYGIDSIKKMREQIAKEGFRDPKKTADIAIWSLFRNYWEPQANGLVVALRKDRKLELARYFAEAIEHLQLTKTNAYWEEELEKLKLVVQGKARWDYESFASLAYKICSRDLNLREVISSVYLHSFIPTIIIMLNNDSRSRDYFDHYIEILNNDSYFKTGYFTVKILLNSKTAIQELKEKKDISIPPKKLDLGIDTNDVVFHPEDIEVFDPDSFFHAVEEFFPLLRNPIHGKFKKEPKSWLDYIKEKPKND